MYWGIDLFFKNKCRAVIKNLCPGILSCSSNTRKSLKMSTSARKKEHLFDRTPTNGFFSCLLVQQTIQSIHRMSALVR